jgi:hypothetical protein
VLNLRTGGLFAGSGKFYENTELFLARDENIKARYLISVNVPAAG